MKDINTPSEAIHAILELRRQREPINKQIQDVKAELRRMVDNCALKYVEENAPSISLNGRSVAPIYKRLGISAGLLQTVGGYTMSESVHRVLLRRRSVNQSGS